MIKEKHVEYYNHNGKLVLTFNDGGVYYAGYGEFKNWNWSYDSKFGKHNNFRLSKDKYPLEVIVRSESKDDRDKLSDILNEDVTAGEPGTLVVRGWSLRCYITSADYSGYSWLLDHKVKFEILADEPGWTRRITRHFNGTTSENQQITTDLWRDYVMYKNAGRRGYNYNYNMAKSNNIELKASGNNNGYEIVIYGAAIDPTIYLNGHPISVHISLKDNEQLRIVSDGNDKRIELLSSYGAITNIFNLRDKEYSQFLTLGSSTELTYGQLKFDITIIERRSEPTWN